MRLVVCIINVFWLLAVSLIAQPDPDWIEQEIADKRQLLADRRQLEKTATAIYQSDYDVGYYGLNLKVDIEHQKLAGYVTIRGKSLKDGLSSIALDFTSSMIVSGVRISDQSFQWVRKNGRDYLVVNFDTAVDSGGIFEVQIDYSGQPMAGGFKGFSFDYHNNVPVVSSFNEPYYASGWFPCKDLPSDKADSVDMNITVPDSLTAVSNGTLVRIVDNQDGTATYCWQERYPIAVYLISIAVSNYKKLEQIYTGLDGTTMPVIHWYYPEDESRTIYLTLTTEMISYFSSLWGEYPFIREKYGHAQFPWSGGMEHQTCTSTGSFSELLICHELAHQWWGDMVTCANWKNIWLNEGFARYSEALWQEHRAGFEGLRDYMDYLNRPEIWRAAPVYCLDTLDVSSIFDRIVYDKGAWVLHMLRHLVGEEKFWDIFLAYRQAFYMSTARTEDFKGICEQVSGKDLDWFFHQWIYTSGQPVYKVAWYRTPQSGADWQLDLDIEQIQQSSDLFKMPIDIAVDFAQGDSLLTVLDTTYAQHFIFNFQEKPENVRIDPDGWLLKTVHYSTIDPDRGYQPVSFKLSAPYPNPFNTMVYFDLYLPYNSRGTIEILDINGRVVRVIERGKLAAGYRQDSWQPRNISSGIYFIRLQNDWVSLSKKIVYLK
jgi:aminopeptidase N